MDNFLVKLSVYFLCELSGKMHLTPKKVIVHTS